MNKNILIIVLIGLVMLVLYFLLNQNQTNVNSLQEEEIVVDDEKMPNSEMYENMPTDEVNTNLIEEEIPVTDDLEAIEYELNEIEILEEDFTQ